MREGQKRYSTTRAITNKWLKSAKVEKKLINLLNQPTKKLFKLFVFDGNADVITWYIYFLLHWRARKHCLTNFTWILNCPSNVKIRFCQFIEKTKVIVDHDLMEKTADFSRDQDSDFKSFEDLKAMLKENYQNKARYILLDFNFKDNDSGRDFEKLVYIFW